MDLFHSCQIFNFCDESEASINKFSIFNKGFEFLGVERFKVYLSFIMITYEIRRTVEKNVSVVGVTISEMSDTVIRISNSVWLLFIQFLFSTHNGYHIVN